jgi:hypothetical protein
MGAMVPNRLAEKSLDGNNKCGIIGQTLVCHESSAVHRTVTQQELGLLVIPSAALSKRAWHKTSINTGTELIVKNIINRNVFRKWRTFGSWNHN